MLAPATFYTSTTTGEKHTATNILFTMDQMSNPNNEPEAVSAAPFNQDLLDPALRDFNQNSTLVGDTEYLTASEEEQHYISTLDQGANYESSITSRASNRNSLSNHGDNNLFSTFGVDTASPVIEQTSYSLPPYRMPIDPIPQAWVDNHHAARQNFSHQIFSAEAPVDRLVAGQLPILMSVPSQVSEFGNFNFTTSPALESLRGSNRIMQYSR